MRIMLAAAIAVLTCGSAAAQERTFERPYWLDRPVIESIGRASVEVRANRARFSVSFRETARDAHEAQANAADRARLAVEAMRRRGAGAVEISSEIEVEPTYEEYRDHDGNVQQREGAQNITGYVATVALEVRVLDPTRAPDIRAAAFAVGPEDSGALNYYVDQTAEMQRSAYLAAVEDAAARARAAARASGAPLGPLLALQEGQGPCMGRWQGPAGVASAPAEQLALTATMRSSSLLNEEAVVVTGSRDRRLQVTAEDISRLQLPDDQTPVRLTSVVCAVYAAAP